MSEESRQLEATITLGMDAEAFLQSNVGQYVNKRALEEIQAAHAQLENVDPDDPAAIRNLQFVIAVARATVAWLREAVAEGRNAAETAVQQDS